MSVKFTSKGLADGTDSTKELEFNVTGVTTGTTRTITVPNSDVDLGKMGKVLQVVQDTLTSTMTTTSQTNVDTGLAVTITPSSTTSKMMIIANVETFWDNSYAKVNLDLTRGDTPIFVGDADGSRQQATSSFYINTEASTSIAVPISFLDSPNTTSATTYKIRIRRGDPQGTVGINRGDSDTNSSIFARVASSIIVMEIGA